MIDDREQIRRLTEDIKVYENTIIDNYDRKILHKKQRELLELKLKSINGRISEFQSIKRNLERDYEKLLERMEDKNVKAL